MAGGTAADIRTPYPKGFDGLFWMQIPVHMIAAEYDEKTVHQFTARFAFNVMVAELTAFDIITTGAVQMDLKDDTGTPKFAFENTTITAITAGAGTVQDLSPVTTVEFYAGAIMTLILDTSNIADAILSGCVTLGLKPLY